MTQYESKDSQIKVSSMSCKTAFPLVANAMLPFTDITDHQSKVTGSHKTWRRYWLHPLPSSAVQEDTQLWTSAITFRIEEMLNLFFDLNLEISSSLLFARPLYINCGNLSVDNKTFAVYKTLQVSPFW